MSGIQPPSARAHDNLVVPKLNINEPQYDRIERNPEHAYVFEPKKQRLAEHYTRSVKPRLEELNQDFHHAKQALKIAISDAENAGDFGLKAELRNKMNALEQAYSECIDQPPGLHRHDGSFQDMWTARLNDLGNAIANSFNAADANYKGNTLEPAYPVSVMAPPTLEPVGVYTPLETDSVKKTDSAAGTDSTKGGDESTGLDVDINRMVELASTDPQKMMEELKGMKLEDRTLVMNQVQQQLQEINQMFSMMSNMQKSIHDTMKAAINNMRV